jgi:ABC-type lipoprotein release transport system permease subunit
VNVNCATSVPSATRPTVSMGRKMSNGKPLSICFLNFSALEVNGMDIGICLLPQHTGLIKLDEASYYVSQVPINLELWHVLALNAGTLFFCFLMMLLPSLIVARISPLKAIRFD